MGRFLLAALVLLLCGCASQQRSTESGKAETARESALPEKWNDITYEGGDGSSIEKAVVIKGTVKPEVLVQSESEWMSRVYPGWRKQGQALLNPNDKYYDRIEIETRDGRKIDVYFDITGYMVGFQKLLGE